MLLLWWRAGATSAVDHFVPWSRYPVDLGHNFVLAHATCNRSKADYLAAEGHLAAWLRRNGDHSSELASRFDQQGVMHDLQSSVQVARWAYSQLASTDGRAWVSGRTMTPLTAEWQGLFTIRQP